mmetsp:Transcript_32717/g.48010  ORF Transcript_32717/g.48010 Transcript_32717/m.48010 type:complete len:290 (+) Transcript_32717:84-953(+)
MGASSSSVAVADAVSSSSFLHESDMKNNRNYRLNKKKLSMKVSVITEKNGQILSVRDLRTLSLASAISCCSSTAESRHRPFQHRNPMISKFHHERAPVESGRSSISNSPQRRVFTARKKIERREYHNAAIHNRLQFLQQPERNFHSETKSSIIDCSEDSFTICSHRKNNSLRNHPSMSSKPIIINQHSHSHTCDAFEEESEEECYLREKMYAHATWRMYDRIMQARTNGTVTHPPHQPQVHSHENPVKIVIDRCHSCGVDSAQDFIEIDSPHISVCALPSQSGIFSLDD